MIKLTTRAIVLLIVVTTLLVTLSAYASAPNLPGPVGTPVPITPTPEPGTNSYPPPPGEPEEGFFAGLVVGDTYLYFDDYGRLIKAWFVDWIYSPTPPYHFCYVHYYAWDGLRWGYLSDEYLGTGETIPGEEVHPWTECYISVPQDIFIVQFWSTYKRPWGYQFLQAFLNMVFK